MFGLGLLGLGDLGSISSEYVLVIFSIVFVLRWVVGYFFV